MLRIAIRCAATFAFAFSCLPASADEGLSTGLMERIKGATVYVKNDFGPFEIVGSGFVIRMRDDTAYVVTNFHVIAKPKTLSVGGHIRGLHGRDKMELRKLERDLARMRGVVSVVVNSGESSEQVSKTEVIAASADPDLAILRVKGIKTPIEPIVVPESPSISETMPVYMFGFPLGDDLSVVEGNPKITVGKGAISSIRKNDAGEIVKVQIDGALHPGNSGGPILDRKGNLVGVAVQTVPGSKIGLAISPREVNEVLAGRVGKPYFVSGALDLDKRIYDLVVPLIDPMQRIKSVTAYCLEGSQPIDEKKWKESLLESNPQSLKYELSMKDLQARCVLPRLDNKTEDPLELTVQLAYVLEGEKKIYTPPAVIKTPLAMKPGAPSGDPAVGERKSSLAGKGASKTAEADDVLAAADVDKDADVAEAADDADEIDEKEAEATPAARKDPALDIKADPKADADEKGPASQGAAETPKAVWTNSIKRMQIPKAEVKGMLDGVEFVPDNVELKGNRLIFRQGSGFLADREVSLTLKNTALVSRKMTVVNGKIRGQDPQAHFSVKREGDKLPKTQAFPDYLMVLEFGDYNDDTRSIPGKFYICFPDKAKSFCAGTFDARAN